MKKRIGLTLKIISAVLVIILPFFIVPVSALLMPSEFDGSFVGALDEKVERLAEIEENKIVIIGGSSVAFGYQSDIIEKYTGMPVVNFGLYAALGTKLMLDLSREHIKEGDIVIIAPELDEQTLSLYFNSASTLRALDGSPELYKYVDPEHTFSLLAASWDFLADKIDYALYGAPEYKGVYNANNFNEYGDLDYERKENVMSLYYDPNTPINLHTGIVDGDFVDYLNEYIALCEDRGASVYFEFCPMNSLALCSEMDEAALSDFENFLRENIDCTFIGASISDYIYEPGYFYDTNFHLNTVGAAMHTVNVTKDLLLELSIPTAVKENIAPMPPLPQQDVRYFGEDVNADMFTYSKLSDGSYMITGVREQYRSLTELTVPLGYDTYKVTAIGKGAFLNSAVKKLIITEDTNISMLANGCFEGAGSLSELWIYYPYEDKIVPPEDFRGTAKEFRVYVPLGSTYNTGYDWGQRGLEFVYIK